MKTNINGWGLEHDPNATRDCYERLPVGSGCDCADCRNFFAAFDRAFPPEFHTLVATFAIDTHKPSELCHYGRDASGLHPTGGWFNFVGSLLSGPEALVPDGTGHPNSFRIVLQPFAPRFEIGFSSYVPLVSEPFRDRTIVRLEFQTFVPWVIGDHETE